MSISKPLARASYVVGWLSAAGVALVPAGTIFTFLSPHWAQAVGIAFAHHGLSHLNESVPLRDRLLACACAMIPAAIATFGLIALTRLLRLYRQGEVFGRNALTALGQITAALFWNVIAAFLMEAPITFFLTRDYPAHHAELQLTIDSGDVEILFLAAVALVISRVMAEARPLADENAGFI
jgi:hypothetical protein